MEKEAQRICDIEKFSKATINNSILGLKNRVDSKIGEMILSDYLGLKLDNSYKYDLTFGLDGKSSIEVKTKRRDVNARPEYIADIAKTSEHQFVNGGRKIIAFLSLNKISLQAEIVGFISVNRLMKLLGTDDAKFIKAGTKLEKNYVQRADGWQIKYSCLMPPETFKEWIKDKK